MPFCIANGISLHYNVKGDGAPLCLVNGYRLSGDAWPDSFIDRLSARCCVISIDNRGTGRSDKPDDGYGFDLQASDIAGLLDHLRISRTNLLGFSMGGAIAQRVAALYPDRVERLILFGTFCGGIWAEPASSSVLSRLFGTEHLSPEAAGRCAWPVTYSAEYLADNPVAAEQQLQREMRHPTPSFVARRQMEVLRTFDAYRDLPRIRAATLVVTGAEDILVKPRNSEILAARIPGARLESLAHLGHRAIWEAPEEIADLIGDFVAGPKSRVPEAKKTGECQ